MSLVESLAVHLRRYVLASPLVLPATSQHVRQIFHTVEIKRFGLQQGKLLDVQEQRLHSPQACLGFALVVVFFVLSEQA